MGDLFCAQLPQQLLVLPLWLGVCVFQRRLFILSVLSSITAQQWHVAKVPSWQRQPHATAQTPWLISSARRLLQVIIFKICHAVPQNIIQICPTKIWETPTLTDGCELIQLCSVVGFFHEISMIWYMVIYKMFVLQCLISDEEQWCWNSI